MIFPFPKEIGNKIKPTACKSGGFVAFVINKGSILSGELVVMRHLSDFACQYWHRRCVHLRRCFYRQTNLREAVFKADFVGDGVSLPMKPNLPQAINMDGYFRRSGR
ncbi:MAG: hypothetical protein KC443_14890 [Anaerolineales bacterium]|nr:hypothetical protein [Anaerolineales bacterium]